MRRHPNALIAMACASALALCAAPRPEDEMTDAERKTPPEPKQANLITDTVLPGETNRQFAERMKAQKQAGGRDD